MDNKPKFKTFKPRTSKLFDSVEKEEKKTILDVDSKPTLKFKPKQTTESTINKKQVVSEKEIPSINIKQSTSIKKNNDVDDLRRDLFSKDDSKINQSKTKHDSISSVNGRNFNSKAEVSIPEGFTPSKIKTDNIQTGIARKARPIILEDDGEEDLNVYFSGVTGMKKQKITFTIPCDLREVFKQHCIYNSRKENTEFNRAIEMLLESDSAFRYQPFEDRKEKITYSLPGAYVKAIKKISDISSVSRSYIYSYAIDMYLSEVQKNDN